MASGKIQNIQALRGTAVLLVVFYHMMKVEGKYAGPDSLLPQFLNIGAAGVDLFFAISGFVMVAVTRNAFQQSSQICRFAYHRITRIYPLYWFYTLLILAVYLIQPALINSSQGNQVNILASFLLLPQKLEPLVNVGWTLIHEIYFYIVFALLLLLPARALLTSLLFWGSAVVAVNTLYPSLSNPFLHLYSSPLTIEFISGSLIALLYYRQPLRGNGFMLVGVAIALLIAGFMLSHSDIDPDNWFRILVFGIPSALALYALLLLESRHKLTLPRWLIKTGDASYSIYLSHVIVLSLIGRVWQHVATAGYLDNIIILPLMLAAVLIVGWLSYQGLEMHILRLTRVLEKRLFAGTD